jgi:hypothetical protein
MAPDQQPGAPRARWRRHLRDFEASLETRVLPWALLVGIVALLFAIMMLVDGLGVGDSPSGDH